jgi:hypothetical protein
MKKLRTYVYIDGFNFYYGSLKGTPYKWLDLEKLCRELLQPHNEILQIRYFTAHLKPRRDDPELPFRQLTYFRALQTIPHLSIHYGHFLSQKVMMPRADNPREKVLVLKTEEKGSDVNLATQLLFDGFHDRYDLAVIIANDSDYLEPVKVVRRDFKKMIGIVNPRKTRPSKVLQEEADFFKSVWPSAMKRSQLPEVLRDAEGAFKKPERW